MTWSVGSKWHRWDPHLHAPGTLRANQYGEFRDDDTWEEYFDRIRNATPTCHALGITDYFVPRGYQLFLERGGRTQLPGVLVFPNIELRLKTKAKKGAVNVHLLVSPEADDHLDVIVQKLQALAFRYKGEEFRCTLEGLTRLGRTYSKDPLDAEGALRAGASQFLVAHDDFATLRQDAWMQQHVLFAVAADNDGLAGLKGQSFEAYREELGELVDVIFSGQPNERRFWLGRPVPKPCLHGSDAHEFDRILAPEMDRRCWIRSAMTFDGLRQTLAEPERRVWIGPFIDSTKVKSRVMDTFTIRSAQFPQRELLLNDGLVTVIGERGSGKTALAELVALAAHADDPSPGHASFLGKARGALGGLSVEIRWQDGAKSERELNEPAEEPTVRYLSQRFVERISEQHGSSDGGTADELVEEIERVVFGEISDEDRHECGTFAELRERVLRRTRATRARLHDQIVRHTSTIELERNTANDATRTRSALAEATRTRKATEKQLKSLPSAVAETHVKAEEVAREELDLLRAAIGVAKTQALQIEEIQREHEKRMDDEENAWAHMKSSFPGAIGDDVWEKLKLKPDPDAADALTRAVAKCRELETALRERGHVAAGTAQVNDGDTDDCGLEASETRHSAATAALNEDQARKSRRARLTKKLRAAKQAEQRARAAVSNLSGSAARLKSARTIRLDAYESLLETFAEEGDELKSLYLPLSQRLLSDERLQKMSVKVAIQVDTAAWVEEGAALFDLRKPPFQGSDQFVAALSPVLTAWGTQRADQVRNVIAEFELEYIDKAMQSRKNNVTAESVWRWLFSIEHVSVRYQIKYDDTDIALLSPGQRGVVLLTLFLGIDDDDRPLVIDQPEDNLDPKSIQTTLVPFFREAAERRQIIMVTHNANLVVNTDSDQVIVATSTRTIAGKLPTFSYIAGGLEDAEIRRLVCQYLEGGAEAFRKRSQRYALRSNPAS